MLNENNKNIIRNQIRRFLLEYFLHEQEKEAIKVKFPIEKIIPNEAIRTDILNIKNIFVENGYKLYLVGGSVRDALLNKVPKDYDLATDAPPDAMIQMLQHLYKIMEIGKAFGIINVVTPSGELEIARFRADVGSGRRPESVEFTTIERDVLRRDLSINALFYDLDTQEIIDYVGGIEDLKKGIIKTVGNPEERFNEDRLRILRVVRFSARFGSELDAETDKALQQDSSLEGISSERIRDEFLKGIKSAKSVIQFLEMLKRYKLFNWIFPDLKIGKFIEEKNPIILLAFLLKQNPIEKLKEILNKLSYTNDEIKKIIFLIYFSKLNKRNAFEKSKAFEKNKFNIVFLKKLQPVSGLTDDEIKQFAKLIGLDEKLTNAFLNFNLSISGGDIAKQGFKGPEISREVERLELANFKELYKK